MTARDDVDAVVAGKLEEKSGGPASRTDIKAALNAVLDYVDGAVVSDVATINTALTGLTGSITRNGPVATLKFILDEVAIPHTDAAGSGSSGSVKLADLAQGAFRSLAALCNCTFIGDTLIDGNVGDMAFVYGVGTAVANAGDKALTGTEVDIVPISSDVTLSSFEASSERICDGVAAGVNLTASGGALYLNESGSATTSDATGVLTVSGEITIILAVLGDN